jgi:hypothetical protein
MADRKTALRAEASRLLGMLAAAASPLRDARRMAVYSRPVVLTQPAKSARTFPPNRARTVDGGKGQLLTPRTHDGTRGELLTPRTVDGAKGELRTPQTVDGAQGQSLRPRTVDGAQGESLTPQTVDGAKGELLMVRIASARVSSAAALWHPGKDCIELAETKTALRRDHAVRVCQLPEDDWLITLALPGARESAMFVRAGCPLSSILASLRSLKCGVCGRPTPHRCLASPVILRADEQREWTNEDVRDGAYGRIWFHHPSGRLVNSCS